MKRALIKYGIIAGATLGLLTLIPFYTVGDIMSYASGEIFGYTAMVVTMMAGVYFGTKFLKQEELEGKISFWRAAGFGVGISFVAAIVFGVFSYLLYEVIDPDFMDRFMNNYEQQIKNSSLSEKEIKNAIAELRNAPIYMKSSFFQAFVMFATVFPIGMVTSIISALLLKKD